MRPSCLWALLPLLFSPWTLAQPISAAPSAVCAASQEIDSPELQGRWRAQFPDSGDSAELELGPHPEWQGMVRGQVRRASGESLMVGDIHQGELTLEESRDGQRIDATWLGEVQAGSCGQILTGELLTDEASTGIPFILYRLKP